MLREPIGLPSQDGPSGKASNLCDILRMTKRLPAKRRKSFDPSAFDGGSSTVTYRINPVSDVSSASLTNATGNDRIGVAS
jgi:hypothetical protein